MFFLDRRCPKMASTWWRLLDVLGISIVTPAVARGKDDRDFPHRRFGNLREALHLHPPPHTIAPQLKSYSFYELYLI